MRTLLAVFAKEVLDNVRVASNVGSMTAIILMSSCSMA